MLFKCINVVCKILSQFFAYNKIVFAWENTLLLLRYCDFISFLSLAETHAGDDRSDAGPDEDEIRRVRVVQGTRDLYPTRSPHPLRSLHMHSLI